MVPFVDLGQHLQFSVGQGHAPEAGVGNRRDTTAVDQGGDVLHQDLIPAIGEEVLS